MQIRCFARLCRFCSCWLLVVTMTTKAMAEKADIPVETHDSYYDSVKQGWFWYHDSPPEEKNELKKEPSQELQKKEQEPDNPSLENYTTQDIWNLHPDNFQKLINGAQKKAVQYPTEKNVLEYMVMQDIARRKALAYTHATQFVNQKYSDLFNINQVYPVTAPGVSARVQTEQQEVSYTIMSARENHALLFFVGQGCGFCEKQAAILTYFIEKYGWQIKTVDIGHDSTVAARFNITTTPTLLLIQQGVQKTMPVSIGVVALSELERKLYQAIRYLNGSTTMDSFQTYDFQKGGALDPDSILEKTAQPWVPYD